ncbi:MAG: sulfotransferase [Gammaproteobacteria bacterium]|nr:sulfotransferase [Gammaproteobacteria bacterium]MCP4090214.1 sulfotransferase [Gammaproteobacteria bacterium]MCP4832965.1 sulfotransferase [Gammaproteobacteria bacterium]MCP4928652.1 sulfotransferase [Gammaproteobacteria bacterium]
MNKTEGNLRATFLVGAGRSGTTLLYKLLCLHPDIAYISNYENRLKWFPDGLAARLIANKTGSKINTWFNQGGNAYFTRRPLEKRIFPTPHEGESVYESCGLTLRHKPNYKPSDTIKNHLRQRFAKIQNGAHAQLFLSKRTANNRRISQLHSVFPEAQYIHLIRDGREVAHSLSLVEWWNNHTIWWDGRTAIEMELAGEERLSICAKNWAFEMQEINKQLAPINRRNILDLRFENLLNNPINTLESVLRFLGLPLTQEFNNAINSLKLKQGSAAWTKHWTSNDLACVMREQEPLLNALGYIDQGSQKAP